MRIGLWGITAVFLGAFSAHFLLRDRGYVLVNYAGYMVEMSVPALVVLLVIAYVCVRAVFGIWRAPRRLGEALADGQVRRAGVKLTRGEMVLYRELFASLFLHYSPKSRR